jgi:hypothetical protein
MKHLLIISILLLSSFLISCEKETYVGERENGKYHGQGTLTYPNKDKYVGELKDGENNGQGTYTYPDGDKYEHVKPSLVVSVLNQEHIPHLLEHLFQNVYLFPH